MATQANPPPSVTNFGLNLVGVLGAIIALVVLHEQGSSGPNAVLLVCAAGVLPIIALDVLVLRVHMRPSTGLDWKKPASPDTARVLTKLLGLTATLAPIALAYFVFPEYGDWYAQFWNVLRRFGLAMVVLAVAYFWLVDGAMVEPRDAYWQLGRVFLFHSEDAKKADIANHYRGWLIKAFYLPLFTVFIHNQLNGIMTYNMAGPRGHKMALFHFLTDGVYALDVLYATVGYVLSFRILDSHVRSAEPYTSGWLVALECYAPFWPALFSRLYLHYDGPGFESWMSEYQNARWGWAVAILLFEGIYLLATFAFGIRFSNLTHRGILTNGPYRYTKHPAYIAKNISWWMITLPFIPFRGGVDAFKSTMGLAGVSAIYFLRARTEERHLSKDPTYVAYALWMNENGLLRFLNYIPFFKYRAPAPPALATTLVSATPPPAPVADATA